MACLRKKAKIAKKRTFARRKRKILHSLYFYAEKPNEGIRYIAREIWLNFGGFQDFTIIDHLSQLPTEEVHLIYFGQKPPNEEVFFLFQDADFWLAAQNFQACGLPVFRDSGAIGQKEDFLAFAFYVLSGYHFYFQQDKDEHGRYLKENYPFKNQLKTPFLQKAFERLFQHMNTFFQCEFQRKTPRSRQHITFDIDWPFFFKGKPLPIQVGSLAKDAWQWNFRLLGQKCKMALELEKDVFDTYDLIQKHIHKNNPQKEITFFMLLNGKSKHDNRFRAENKHLLQLIQKIKKNNFHIGYHAAYESFCDEKFWKEGLQSLAAITKTQITKNRQHFLKFRYPNTFEYMEKSGIQDDYSVLFSQISPFPMGVARPFHWFNLAQFRETKLRLHTGGLMDRTFLKMGVEKKEVPAYYKSYLQEVKKHKGEALFIFHNNTFSNFGEWEGWQSLWCDILEMIQNADCS